ncbi:MAG: MBL fold metallo-hydrolase [Planctomycetes bacterium]|nr:MBL fold metallo-hydrolase [Planctomycetota bacterium]
MEVQQFYLGCLAHASYLIADPKCGVAAVIDPQRDIEQYVRRAEELGVEIRHVLLTHFHADFVAGHLELRDRYGATIYVGRAGRAEYDCQPLADGDVIEFGVVRIVAMETPGHTPEGICYVLHDLHTAPETPKAVFTGDTLFVGDVGRPDLMASVGVTAEELAGQLYHSLHDKLLQLPDSTVVYPAHGAGSMCGKNLGEETFSTIGQQRAFNYALQPMTKDEFIAVVTADQPTAPRYFGFDAQLNKRERPTIDQALASGLRELGLAEFAAAVANGAQVVDCREEDAFAAGTFRGAWNLPLSGSFATWSGSLLELRTPIVLLADVGKHTEAVTRLARVGIDTCVGYLDGGADALRDHPEYLQTTGRIDARELRARFEAGEELAIVDVRTPREVEAEPLPSAVHVPLIQLADRIGEVPERGPLYVICRSGKRSATAVSMLAQRGRTDVVNVAGGSLAWYAAKASAAR